MALQQEYLAIPPITRAYTTTCLLTTLAVQLDYINLYQLYFHPVLIFKEFQLWRLFTCFCFFGTIGFNFFFNLLFTYRYCRHLEEGSFRGRAADFLLMFLFGGTIMIIMALFLNVFFLGSALTIMLVYVWSRRNPFVRMNFFGLLNFQAPYLPWVLLAFSLLLGNPVLMDAMGIVVGHVYYFLEDIFPRQQGGFRILKTPRFLQWLFDEVRHPIDDNDTRPNVANDEPFGAGGFHWQ